jgi:hypothetical protein
MLLFRSEDHVDRWCASHHVSRGAVFTPAQMWTLATLWHSRRLDPDWRRFTIDEAHAVFERAGLTGSFWRLDQPTAR